MLKNMYFMYNAKKYKIKYSSSYGHEFEIVRHFTIHGCLGPNGMFQTKFKSFETYILQGKK